MVVWHQHSIQSPESRVSAKPTWSPCTFEKICINVGMRRIFLRNCDAPYAEDSFSFSSFSADDGVKIRQAAAGGSIEPEKRIAIHWVPLIWSSDVWAKFRI